MQLERGLSINTVKAYKRDLNKLIQWLSEKNMKDSPALITQDALRS